MMVLKNPVFFCVFFFNAELKFPYREFSIFLGFINTFLFLTKSCEWQLFSINLLRSHNQTLIGSYFQENVYHSSKLKPRSHDIVFHQLLIFVWYVTLFEILYVNTLQLMPKKNIWIWGYVSKNSRVGIRRLF